MGHPRALDGSRRHSWPPVRWEVPRMAPEISLPQGGGKSGSAPGSFSSPVGCGRLPPLGSPLEKPERLRVLPCRPGPQGMAPTLRTRCRPCQAALEVGPGVMLGSRDVPAELPGALQPREQDTALLGKAAEAQGASKAIQSQG